MKLNNNFEQLSKSYLFSEVKSRVDAFTKNHPDAEIIRMDIGDVSKPIVEPVVQAMADACREMGKADTFRGYGPEQGYDFLREAIAENDYRQRGVDIRPDEIFVSDGAKCDIANLTDIFDADCVVAMQDPVYPVYYDSNVIAGRTTANGKLHLLQSDAQCDFKPSLPKGQVDIIYLCSPNNPTGTVLSKKNLTEWVEYALNHNSLIIFDSAYEAFVRDDSLPRSIYEIQGAEKVAIEVRSFSKTAGFTGLRCGYTVVPSALKEEIGSAGLKVAVKDLWLRRQTTKFNGASYVIQKAASALYLPEVKELLKRQIDEYLRNALLLKKTLNEKFGSEVFGGDNSPYVWFHSSSVSDSWELFDLFLNRCMLSTTPGVGFGKNGQGCLRFTGFNTLQNTERACERILNSKL